MSRAKAVLDPSLLGMRLTIRLNDPDGGYRDLVGILENMTSIRKRDGDLVSFNPDDIAIVHEIKVAVSRAGSGAPLSLRIAELENLSTVTWPPRKSEMFGNWQVRVSEGSTFRANSVLPLGTPPYGEPGVDLESALQHIGEIYAAANLPTVVHLPLPMYQDFNDYLIDAGWQIKVDAQFLVQDLSESPILTEIEKQNDLEITIESEATDEFLALHGDQILKPIMNSYPANYVALKIGDEYVATARVAILDHWSIVTRLYISQSHRRRGFAELLMNALMEIARQAGATKVGLQVDLANPGALALYQKLGFRYHHNYQFLQKEKEGEGSC
jgi:GNAT superfamily N-acetyltransferase